MEINERWLSDIAGWQVVRDARRVQAAGAVRKAAYDGKELLQGMVMEGGRELACGLRIITQTNVDNLCPCQDSRARGMICRHSVALGLEWIKPATVKQSSAMETKVANKTAPPVKAGPVLQPKGVLSVIIAPDFYAKWQKNVFVAQCLVQGTATDPADASLWLALQALGVASVPPVMQLDREQAAFFLDSLSGHPRVLSRGSGKGTTQPFAVVKQPARLALALEVAGVFNLCTKKEELTQGLKTPATFHASDSTLKFQLVSSDKPQLIFGGKGPVQRAWLLEPNRLVPLPPFTQEVKLLLAELEANSNAFRPPIWLLEHRESLNQVFVLEASDDYTQKLRLVKNAPQFVLSLEGSLRFLEADLRCVYPVATFKPQEELSPEISRLFPYANANHPSVFSPRHLEAEAAANARMQEWGFRMMKGKLVLEGEKVVMGFYAEHLREVQHDWKVELGERFRHVTRGIEFIRPQVKALKGDDRFGSVKNDWLHLQVSYAADSGLNLPRAEVQRLLRSGQPWSRLPNGKTVVLDAAAVEDFEEVLRDCEVEQTTTGGIRVRGAQQAYLLNATGSSSSLNLRDEGDLRRDLGDLASLLRPYQFEGVSWLEARARAGFGGLLADEMGLGKTLQSLALVRAFRRGKALVVCPTSLLGNWEVEAKRFVPEIKVLIHHGTARHDRDEEWAAADLILTSYALLARDIERLGKENFALVFFDEAGFLRNPDTQQAKAARQLKASARFALTGTPVENSVRDLWSIFQCILPGYLGAKEDFKLRYEQPLAAGGTAREVLARLRRRLEPWLLRRLKTEVVRDLPARLEQIQWCDLTPFQNELYRRVLTEAQESVQDARHKKNAGSARMGMFTALLRLRQICNDARLIGLDAKHWKNRDEEELSGKWAALEEWLRELEEGGHRCLIFSQFVGMLSLVRARLEKATIPFCYLDGSTVNRQEQVQRFQNEPANRVFLISLKAGGYGLNLTAADHVILLDPWWNPAVEAQAIDRAHRIGQERVVTGVRFITRGTVEEKILALQKRKRDVMDAAIDEIEPGLTGLNDAELEDLLHL